MRFGGGFLSPPADVPYMAKTVLVAVDGSQPSHEALDHAFEEHPDADIVALTVVDPAEAGYSVEGAAPDFPQEWRDTAEQEAEEVLADAEQRAERAGLTITTASTVGRPANAIVEYAEEQDIDHIVIGSHGRSGMSRILLGSVAETVMRRSSVPVTVVR